MWTSHKKEYVWSIFLFIFIFFSISQISNLTGNLIINPVPKLAAVTSASDRLTEKQTNIKLGFVGDIMLDRGVESSVYKNFYGDYSGLFSKVKDQLNSYDFLFGNLEGPVSDKGVDGGGLYSFRMDPVVLPVLKDAGFKAFSLDNNHILNYGPEAVIDTEIRLVENDFMVVGNKPFVMFGIKFMILTYNQFSNLDLEQMKKEISLARSTNDLVITYYHFGEEYQTQPNDYQRTVSKLAVDSGADLVVGAHPHVVQTIEQYKNVWIAYSLGNFVFDQYFSKETMQGGLLEVEINPGSKRIEKVALKKVILNKLFQIENII